MGSLPFSSMYFSMSRFSKTVPVFLETTGSSGASPETVVFVSLSRWCSTGTYVDCKRGWMKTACRVEQYVLAQSILSFPRCAGESGPAVGSGWTMQCDGWVFFFWSSRLELIKAGTVLQPRLLVAQKVEQGRYLEEGTLINVL